MAINNVQSDSASSVSYAEQQRPLTSEDAKPDGAQGTGASQEDPGLELMNMFTMQMVQDSFNKSKEIMQKLKEGGEE